MDLSVIVALPLLLVLIALVWYWCSRVVVLMSTEDNDMPGRYDKVLWLVLFIVVPVLTPFVFDAAVRRHNNIYNADD